MSTKHHRALYLGDARSYRLPALARQGAAVALGVMDARDGAPLAACPFADHESDLRASWLSGWDIATGARRARVTHAALTHAYDERNGG